MTQPYNPAPLLQLLVEEDPLELAWLLDEQVQVLIDRGEQYMNLSSRCYLLRKLRDALLACGHVPTNPFQHPPS